MNAPKQALSGVTQSVPVGPKTHRQSTTKSGVQVSANGVTFPSSTYIAPFTEVQVKVQLPKNIANGHFLNCRGVVVDCHGTSTKSRFEVAVAFLNLPKNVENELRLAQRTMETNSITASATRLG